MSELTQMESGNKELLSTGLGMPAPGRERPLPPVLPPDDDFAPASRDVIIQKLTRPSLSYWQDAWIRLKKNKQALSSLGIIIMLLMFTLLGPFFWTVNPADQDVNHISQAPTFKNTAVVVPDLEPFDEIILENVPAEPANPIAAENLPAPAHFRLIGAPSIQSIRLQWDHVEGAKTYALYRSETAPADNTNLGIPLTEIDAANKVSFEDQLDLKQGHYFYSLVAKNDVESPKYAILEVIIPETIALTEAQKFVAEAQVGQTVSLPPHPLGTDYLGRDMLARLMAGARVSLFIGFFAPLFYTFVGIFIGGISGYFGGRVDRVLMSITDFVLALPFLLFMILFKVSLGLQAGEGGIMAMMVALILLAWVGPARLIRGQILQLRESEFVQASRLLGARPLYLIFRHMIPNTLGVLLVSLTFSIPSAIFTEAFLSFIGMGVVPPTPSWGSMANDGISTFLVHPHEFFFPAIMISITVLAFNLLGDGLRDALDPKMRSVQ